MKLCLKCEHRFTGHSWTCPACQYTPPIVNDFLAFAPLLAEVNDGFDISFFQDLAGMEAQHFWFRARNQLIVWALQHYFPEARKFLEVGCGTAFVLWGIGQACPEIELSGSEIFCEGLRFAAERLSNGTLFQMDARQIPFDAEFDVIGAFDVLEHIEEDEYVLRQMYKALRPRGGLMLTVPQHPWLWSQADVGAHHVRRYQVQELQMKVEAAGFHQVRTTSFVALLLPLMLISRLRRQKLDKNYDPNAEFTISPWLNTTLASILAFEGTLIKAGISFPIGGSRLVVAHKRS